LILRLASVLSFSYKKKGLLRNIIQGAIVDLDVLLEGLKHQINGLQVKLFFLSMWIDRRFDI